MRIGDDHGVVGAGGDEGEFAGFAFLFQEALVGLAEFGALSGQRACQGLELRDGGPLVLDKLQQVEDRVMHRKVAAGQAVFRDLFRGGEPRGGEKHPRPVIRAGKDQLAAEEPLAGKMPEQKKGSPVGFERFAAHRGHRPLQLEKLLEGGCHAYIRTDFGKARSEARDREVSIPAEVKREALDELLVVEVHAFFAVLVHRCYPADVFCQRLRNTS